MGDGNYNVKMESGEGSDGKKYVVIRIEDIDADFGDSSTGKTRKVAFGRVWFKDSRGNTVRVQLNANRNK